MTKRSSTKPTNKRLKKVQGMSTLAVVSRPPMVSLPRTVYGFPPRIRTKLRYAGLENLSLSSAAGSVARYAFSCNSTFDPDRSGTGHQPMYRDTYAGIYDQYAVISSKITAQFINSNVANVFNIGMVIEDDTTLSTTLDTVAEQSTSIRDVLGIASSSRSVVTLTKSWDCASFLNIDPFTSATYKTAVGSNPAEEMFFFLWANEIGAGTAALDIQVEVEYDVIFTELSSPSQS